MGIIDDILEKYKIKYEDIEPEEQETLNAWLGALNKSQITVEKVREYIHEMKSSVEDLLSKEPEFHTILFLKIRNDNNILLKARLRNYLLLESFLSTPERARDRIEEMVGNLMPKT